MWIELLRIARYGVNKKEKAHAPCWRLLPKVQLPSRIRSLGRQHFTHTCNVPQLPVLIALGCFLYKDSKTVFGLECGVVQVTGWEFCSCRWGRANCRPSGKEEGRALAEGLRSGGPIRADARQGTDRLPISFPQLRQSYSN